MVFYLLPKCLKRYPQKSSDNGATTITYLPDELLLHVLRDVDTLSVLRFRLSCKDVVPSCNSALQQRLKTIYIHPSARSLQTTLKICEHPVFKEEIDQVTLLGKPMWREIEKAYPEYRKNLQVDLRSEREYPTCRNSKFRAWPLKIYPESPLAEEARGKERGPVVSYFDEAYAPLIEALTRLPKLRTLVFAESVYDPGFNQIPQSAIEAHAHKCGLDLRRGEEKRLADSVVFYGLLFNSRLQFNSVRQERELPFIEHSMSKLIRDNITPDSSANPLRSVRRLEISFDRGWDCNQPADSDLYHLLLRYASNTLQILKITIIPNLSSGSCKPQSKLSILFDDLMLRELNSLEIEYLDCITSQSTTKRDNRQRPACEMFDIVSFLSGSLHTLAAVSFQNVTYCHNDEHSGTFVGALQGIRAVRSLLQNSTRLEHMKWLVKFSEHDVKCKGGGRRPGCRNFDCHYYEMYVNAGYTSTLQDFVILAAELGVELDTERMAWDFGENVASG